MPLVKRLVKGSPLTYAEADGNLTYLDNKVTGSVGLIPVFDSVNTVTGSDVISQLGNNIIVDGGLTIYGDLTARQYIVSSSVSHFTESFSSGSTRFGDTITDTHVFTGSVYITGSQTLDGFLSSSDGAYFSNQITVTHMTIGHGPTENNTNTTIGWNTMPVLASGLRNTMVGASSGQLIQSGNDNTVFGNNALVLLVSGSANTAIGQNAGFSALGSGNVFLGHQAGNLQTTGSNKLWIANSNTLTPLIKGDFSTGLLQFNTSEGTQITGSLNVSNAVTASYFKGDGSALTNLPGSSTPTFIATGSVTASVDVNNYDIFKIKNGSAYYALINDNTNNTSFGGNTIPQTSTGTSNTAFGGYVLGSLTSGLKNTGIGYLSLSSITFGNNNTAIGNNTLLYIATESFNTAIGSNAGENLNGQRNTLIGNQTLTNSLTGSNNTVIGHTAGFNNYGNNNVFLGYQAGYNEAGSNKLYITNTSGSTPLIKGDFNTGLLQFNTAAGTKITGSFLVTGSSVFSGSATGVVNSLSITSNTASLDLSRGNFFTLQLVGGADTYINPSNITPGQTVSILISTVGSGTVSFPITVLQSSGSSYVPTTTTGKDVITLVSFDSSNLYLANVKNLV